MRRIHIVGCGPRTGTTLMAELMGTCFDINASCQHEESVFALPDAAVRESRERVRSALENSGFAFPKHRITANLAPGCAREQGNAERDGGLDRGA